MEWVLDGLQDGKAAVLCVSCLASAGRCFRCGSHPEERDRAYAVVREVASKIQEGKA